MNTQFLHFLVIGAIIHSSLLTNHVSTKIVEIPFQQYKYTPTGEYKFITDFVASNNSNNLATNSSDIALYYMPSPIFTCETANEAKVIFLKRYGSKNLLTKPYQKWTQDDLVFLKVEHNEDFRLLTDLCRSAKINPSNVDAYFEKVKLDNVDYALAKGPLEIKYGTESTHYTYQSVKPEMVKKGMWNVKNETEYEAALKKLEASGFTDLSIYKQVSTLEKKIIKLMGDYDAKYGDTIASKEDIAVDNDIKKRRVTALKSLDARVKVEMLSVAKCSQKMLGELAPSNLKGDWKAYFNLLQTAYKAPAQSRSR